MPVPLRSHKGGRQEQVMGQDLHIHLEKVECLDDQDDAKVETLD